MPELLFEYAEPHIFDERVPFKSFSLDKWINKSGIFEKLSVIRSFMTSLLKALDAIHSVGAMHRDIKPANMVIDKDETLKVIDFDLAEFLDERYDLKFGVSTKGYKAPESFLRQKKYDYRFDVYSAGCILAGILYKSSPFFEYEEGDDLWHSTALITGVQALVDIDYNHSIYGMYIKKWRHMKKVNLFEDFSKQQLEAEEDYPLFEEAFQMLEQMLTLDYTKRPNAKDLLRHPFLLNPKDNKGKREEEEKEVNEEL